MKWIKIVFEPPKFETFGLSEEHALITSSDNVIIDSYKNTYNTETKKHKLESRHMVNMSFNDVEKIYNTMKGLRK